jgi:hypothetical protein
MPLLWLGKAPDRRPAARPTTGLSFAKSPVLFPDPELRAQLAVDYEAQCRLLLSAGDYPSLEQVLARFEEIRELV